MTLLRKGYVTRYLRERLAFGLAPESLNAFFVQRQRWARRAIQISVSLGRSARARSHLDAAPAVPAYVLDIARLER